MAFDMLPALRPRQWRCTICVRVSRKWEYRGGTDDGPIQHVDLVLIDEKGNAMYGEIPESEVESKSPLIQEGGIYVISRFRVSNAKSSYRPVASRYMVEFTLHTTVSPAKTELPDFPRCVYRMTPISDLPSRAGDTRDFVDTIGVLVEKTDAYTIHLPNKPAPTLTRHIVLRDLSYSEIKITLWGERATAFNTDGVNPDGEDKPIVVLFVGGLMKSYQGTYYISANTASRWYFNPPIAEARQYYDSYRNQTIQIRTVPAPAENQGQLQPPAPLEERTLRELNDMDPYDFSEHGYRCSVTIGRLADNASWWFPSCTRCSKSCVVDGSGYRCNGCSITSFRFKYKISFTALDGIDEAEMVCFGDVARRMIGKPVQQLLRTSPNVGTYPPEITKMVSLRFTFQVVLSQQSYYRHQKTYQVVSVATSHGQQDIILPTPSTPRSGGSISATSSGGSEMATPASVAQSGASSALTINTPPSAIRADDAPTGKADSSSRLDTSKSSAARKRLTFESDASDKTNFMEETLAQESQAAKSTDGASTDAALNSLVLPDMQIAGNKKARGTLAQPQQSG